MMRHVLRVALLLAAWCAAAAAFARAVLDLRVDVRLGFFHLVVKDASRALAVAGILGGLYLLVRGPDIWKAREGWLKSVLNQYLYGSPLASGYGGASSLYALSRGRQNLVLYLGWLREAHGVLGLLMPLGMLLPGAVPIAARPGRRGGLSPKVLVVGVTAAVWLCYLFYYSFDDRFFLRFLLPAWPMMSVAAAAALAWGARYAPARLRPLVLLSAWVVVCAVQWHTAVKLGVFRWQEGEQRYVQVARAVANGTPANAMIVAMQHSSSLRYYTHRPTLRYDELPPAFLDKAVADLAAKGYKPYAVLEDFEVAEFRKRFASSPRGRLAQDPLNNGMPARAFLFDLLEPGEPRNGSGRN